ncbi:phosphoglycerate mutase family protein [Paucibacter sp. APW11]|uniref:Phosphoglycerate mutase family protein n=1 Tax=Roseateles aquae TaxID=3077235 RepID=A0ABU3PCQ1_9BURK|nr:phosphoglycerate mutase family protein [Paucibacter sp. APW11]MDT9000102.1 phosphoglycerate mutase family protein [Paucibacter sp. APW11]
MKRTARAVALLAGLLAAGSSQAQQQVFLVRHGEKLDASSDSPLSPAGLARAERLAEMLAGSGIRAIYCSEYQRTRQLAEPLARRLGLSVIVVSAREPQKLLQHLRSHGGDEAVLVVGHSNTVPALIQALGVAQPPAIAEDQFDQLFLLVPKAGEAPVLARLRY